MRVSIGQRLFLTLTLVSLVIVSVSAIVTRWSFERGFVDYVAEQEAEQLAGMADALATLYSEQGNWDSLEENPRAWGALLRDVGGDGSSAGPRAGLRPPPLEESRRPPPDGGRRPPANARREDPLNFHRRISLLDAAGKVIIGREQRRGIDKSVAVLIDGEAVGFVAIARLDRPNSKRDKRFLDRQEKSVYMTAAIALLIAALISALLARQLTRPIRSLAIGAHAMAAGDFTTRIAVEQNDELGELAEDFNRLSATLEKNREARQQWVADIAHELRTPLSILQGELHALEDGVRKFNSGTVASLQAEVARLTKLVADLHDLSVSDEGGLSYDRERLDLVSLIRAVVENARQRLKSSDIDLTLQLPEHELVCIADAARLEQLLANLIENTLRYTDIPGTLCVSCKASDNVATLIIADSAPGVPAEALSQLFDRLFRVDSSRSRDTGGSGLGLSICKSIVTAHGGTISASSSEHGGVEIRVRLPLADLKGSFV